MAATRKAGNFSLDSNEFDAEFEKFMNEVGNVHCTLNLFE